MCRGEKCGPILRVVATMLAGPALACALSGCDSDMRHHTSTWPVHYNGGQFENPPGSPQRQGGVPAFVGFLLGRVFAGRPPEIPPGHVLAKEAVVAGLMRNRDRDSVTWLGHSTTLIRLDGKTVLTDPFLGDYASPLPPLGPRRFVAPALGVADLPQVDVVIVSHNHYDHLDAATVEALPGKEHITAAVPLGMGDFFRARGYTDVRELDWGESTRVDSLSITATPAIHFSRRGLFDYNRVLWCSFVLATPSRRVFFAGDTAYGPVYRRIGERHGPFDLAVLPIGAYEPRGVMVAAHATPEEALTIARDIHARRALGIHWGTIVLTAEPPFEPPLRFLMAAAAAGLDSDAAWLMAVGETRAIIGDWF